MILFCYCRLDSEMQVKVADFGLSKGLDLNNKIYFQQLRNKSMKLPVKWLALESIEYGIFTEKTDIVCQSLSLVIVLVIFFFFQWAYGISCWEIFSGGKIPYSGSDFYSILSLLRSGKRMEKPDNEACTNEM